MKKKGLLGFLGILILIIALSAWWFFSNNDFKEPVACTEDARICPDETAVVRVGPDCEFEKCPISKICQINSDCIVFGEDGDCNCGCYNKNALPTDDGGDCFCAAPVSCECVDNQCEPALD